MRFVHLLYICQMESWSVLEMMFVVYQRYTSWKFIIGDTDQLDKLIFIFLGVYMLIKIQKYEKSVNAIPLSKLKIFCEATNTDWSYFFRPLDTLNKKIYLNGSAND